MNTVKDPNNADLKEGLNTGAYLINRAVCLKELSAFFYELEHLPTGAKHIHISNQDAENTFSVGFKTVPEDSTGVAHILEHTVLCGSKKYPVRDPFFSMLKRSLNTFMNAFTGSDWTIYPFSTQNKKDFYNLMDVYLDSVFYPVIDELSFKQEGCRIEIENDQSSPDGFSLVYKGVVYNEMKGAMSSRDQALFRYLMNSIYPSTTYSYNSGGDPEIIPRLTYEQLKAFHRRHYHPSNAFFYTYGNLSLEEHLKYIHENALKEFEKIDPKTKVPSQPRWDKPITARYSYPLSINDDPSKKCQICVAWLASDLKDSFEVLSLILLERILLGNSASPLRKALIDSGLGTALSDGTGFDRDNRDTLFACGLKDVDESSAEQIEKIIFEVLEGLSKNGIDKEMIDSAIHQLEFHRKEKTNTPYPYGIQLMLAFSSGWFHGADPVRMLEFDEDIEKIRGKISESRFFEEMIKKYFLDNTHRVLFKLVPDQSLEQKEAQRVLSELVKIKQGLKPADLEKIKQDQLALAKLQDQNYDPSCLPTLGIEDIPPDVQKVKEENLLTLYAYNLPTSGIFYLSSSIGIKGINREDLPLIPVFAYVFTKTGTSKSSYVEMAKRIDAHTGGIGMGCHAHSGYHNSSQCISFMSLAGKSLDRNVDRLFEIIEELTGHSVFNDLERLKTLLFQYRAGLESRIIYSGHRLAMSLAARSFTRSKNYSEIWNGIHQLKTIKKMTDNLSDNSLKDISEKLSLLWAVLKQNDLNIAMIGDEGTIRKASIKAESMLELFKDLNTTDNNSADLFDDNEYPFEGWSTSSSVSFVASAFKTKPMNHEDGPVLFVTSKLLRSMYLHREIREKGGAYGGYAIYDFEDGIFFLSSYRDPHIITTLNAYDGVFAFLRSGGFDETDIKEAILQACSEIDRPDSPGTSGQKAFFRKIIGLSDDERQRFKEGVLAVNVKKVIDVSEKYFDTEQNKRSVAIISGESQLKEANEKLDKRLSIYNI